MYLYIHIYQCKFVCMQNKCLTKYLYIYIYIYIYICVCIL